MQHASAEYVRANLSAFFIVSCLLSLAIQIPTGHMGYRHLLLTLPLIPAAMAGYWLVQRYGHLLPQEHLRQISLGLCSVSGSVAVASYWF